ncbi:hypothetical protein NL448_28695, partial [Klebsiella pneumoniae]|nr:hypothetical protein [Klebsiella pneumoniae]
AVFPPVLQVGPRKRNDLHGGLKTGRVRFGRQKPNSGSGSRVVSRKVFSEIARLKLPSIKKKSGL